MDNNLTNLQLYELFSRFKAGRFSKEPDLDKTADAVMEMLDLPKLCKTKLMEHLSLLHNLL